MLCCILQYDVQYEIAHSCNLLVYVLELPEYSSGNEYDAHEFLLHLLNKVRDDSRLFYMCWFTVVHIYGFRSQISLAFACCCMSHNG